MSELRFGIIGCGLMGREFAAAAARWAAFDAGGPVPPRPKLVAVCDVNPEARRWFERNVPEVLCSTDDYKTLLDRTDVEALYIAVPHNLHARLYVDAINAGKHLLGEKPFGIDAAANGQINKAMQANPGTFVRCSSEMPFFPGGQEIAAMVRRGEFGRIIEVEAGFWHSSDLNPDKSINWKRQISTCGAYGCLGDLGMHALHLPIRFGWQPQDVRCVLSKLVSTRPDGKGNAVPCETPENGTIFGRVCMEDASGPQDFPLTVSTKRVAPGHSNTWFINIVGTRQSASYSTQRTKTLRTLPYSQPGQTQAWHEVDVPHRSAYATITGGIFEFGFTDAISQMWAAFCDECVNGTEGMIQPNKPGGQAFHCVTPREAEIHHAILTAAMQSHEHNEVVRPDYARLAPQERA